MNQMITACLQGLSVNQTALISIRLVILWAIFSSRKNAVQEGRQQFSQGTAAALLHCTLDRIFMFRDSRIILSRKLFIMQKAKRQTAI